MSGGVATGTDIWKWDGTNAVEISASGVERKPGATLVYRGTEGKLSLTITGGKVTGWTGSGKGVDSIATGSAASLAGNRTPGRQNQPAWGHLRLKALKARPNSATERPPRLRAVRRVSGELAAGQFRRPSGNCGKLEPVYGSAPSAHASSTPA
jgi:hypothetical protein